MPEARVDFFQESDGRSPVLNWLVDLRRRDASAFANCMAAIVGLRRFGHDLRRPAADYLQDGVYELRARRGRVHYRMLYFFHGRNVAILAHGLTKEGVVPIADIRRAIERKRRFEAAPDAHRSPYPRKHSND